MRSLKELESERQKDLEEIDGAEATALLLLLRVSKKAISGRASDLVKADRLFTAVSESVVNARNAAMSSSLDRTRQQLKAIGVTPSPGRIKVDHRLRAERAGHGIANRWLTSEIDEKPFNLPNNVNFISTSEVVQAFNQARTEELNRLPPEVLVELTKTWQTSGAKNVCQVCLPLEGMTIKAAESFPQGDPPIHGGCQCTYTIDRI